MQNLERCVVIMYSKGCGLAKVNEARHGILQLVKKDWRTSHALKQLCLHTQKSTASGQLLLEPSELRSSRNPRFQEVGWQNEDIGIWLPYWTTLEDASKACCILLHCICERSCTMNCKCSAAGIRWTGLCKYEGGRVNNADV